MKPQEEEQEHPQEKKRRGTRHPYISVAEICDWLNERGSAKWRVQQVRDLLRRAGALITMPENIDPAELQPRDRRRTKRRQWYTTYELLLANAKEMYIALFLELDDEEVADLFDEI